MENLFLKKRACLICGMFLLLWPLSGHAHPSDNIQPMQEEDSQPWVIDQDGPYTAYSNGIVKDSSTGLEWKTGPNEMTDWNQARAWVQGLKLDGGQWRMPTMKELEGLYKKRAGDRNMTPLLKTTGWWVWSGETKGSSDAWFFNFNYGYRYWDGRYISYNGRAFAVRSQKGR